MIKLPSGRKISKGALRNASNIAARILGHNCLRKEDAEKFGLSFPLPKYWQLVVAGMVDPKDLPLPKNTARRKARKVGDSFYTSWEWKKARYDALARFKHRCQCCGWSPGDTPSGYLVVDHIKPRRRFPELALDVGNLQVLCNDCNMGKGGDAMDDFREMDERYRATMME